MAVRCQLVMHWLCSISICCCVGWGVRACCSIFGKQGQKPNDSLKNAFFLVAHMMAIRVQREEENENINQPLWLNISLSSFTSCLCSSFPFLCLHSNPPLLLLESLNSVLSSAFTPTRKVICLLHKIHTLPC